MSQFEKRYATSPSAKEHTKEEYEAAQRAGLDGWFAEAARRDGYGSSEEMVKSVEDSRKQDKLQKTEEYIMSVPQLRFAYMIAQEINRLSAIRVPEGSDEAKQLDAKIDDKEDNLNNRLIEYRNSLDSIADPAERQAAIQAYNDAESLIIDTTEDYLSEGEISNEGGADRRTVDGNTTATTPQKPLSDLETIPIDRYSFDEDIDLVSPSLPEDGVKKPITARDIAQRLNAEGKDFSLDELKNALEGDELDDLSDREKYLLNQLESQKEDFVKELESLKSQLDALKKTPATLVNVAPERGEKKSRLLSKWKKIGAGVLAAVSFFGLGFGAGRMLDNDKTEVPQSQPAATAEADVSVAKIAPDFPYNQGQFGELQDLGEAEASEESLSGYDLSNTHEYYKDGGRESLWAYGPALPTDKDGLVRELSTRVERDPTLAAAWDSTCFAENMSTEEAQACIDLFHTDANAWKESGEKLKQLLNDPNTTFDFFDLTGSNILSSYINDDGKYGELLTNDIISDGTGVHIVNKQMGIDFYMRTDCGGQVFKFIEGGSTPTLPGIYTSETPPPPNTDKPSVPVTPLTPDNPPTPPEAPTTPDTPKSNNPDDYMGAGDDGGTDAGEGEKPLAPAPTTPAESEPQVNTEGLNQQPGSEAEVLAPKVNNETVDTGSTEKPEDTTSQEGKSSQDNSTTNTGIVTGP